MDKLLRLKKWMTLEEAARYLSSTMQEQVAVADVLRLVLDGHLTLSVDLATPVQGKLGTAISTADAATLKAAGNEPAVSFVLSDDEVMVMDDRLRTVTGFWDFARWGGEDVDLQNMLDELTGAEPIERQSRHATWLRGPGATYCELYQPVDSVDGAEGEPAYVTATGVPKGCRLGLRVSEVHRFLGELAQDEAPLKTLGRREEATYLNIIGALLELMLEPGPNGKPRGGYEGQAAIQEGMLTRYPGVPGISKRTLEEKFPQARQHLKAR